METRFAGEMQVTIRASVLQHGQYPVVSQTQVLVAFVDESASGR